MKLLIIATLALTLTGCSASSALDLAKAAVKPDTGITAQVGAENTKQGVGVSSKVDSSKEEKKEQRDVSGNAKVDNSTTEKGVSLKDVNTAQVDTSKKAQSIGPIQAEKVNVSNGSVWPLVAFCGFTLLLVFIFCWMLLKRRPGRSGGIDEHS